MKRLISKGSNIGFLLFGFFLICTTIISIIMIRNYLNQNDIVVVNDQKSITKKQSEKDEPNVEDSSLKIENENNTSQNQNDSFGNNNSFSRTGLNLEFIQILVLGLFSSCLLYYVQSKGLLSL